MIKKLTVLMFAALLSFSGASAITSCSNDDVLYKNRILSPGTSVRH